MEDTGIVVSPSRFSPLMGIDEEEGEKKEAEEKEIEDGEIVANKEEGQMILKVQTPHRGKRTGVLPRGPTVRAKELLLAGKQGQPKKASIRKL